MDEIKSLFASEIRDGGKKGSISSVLDEKVIRSLSNEIPKMEFSIGKRTGMTVSKVGLIPVSTVVQFINNNKKFVDEVDRVKAIVGKEKNVSWSLATMAGKSLGMFQETFTYGNGVNQICLCVDEDSQIESIS